MVFSVASWPLYLTFTGTPAVFLMAMTESIVPKLTSPVVVESGLKPEISTILTLGLIKFVILALPGFAKLASSVRT